MTATAPATVSPRLRSASRAVYVVFIAAGMSLSSWLSRIPQVRDELGLSPGALGLLLLMVAVGSLVALPLAGVIVHRLGARRAVFLLSLVFAFGLSMASIGVLVGAPMVAVFLVVTGFGTGTWDVAMNVEAAAVEQQLGWPIMSRFHAAFSVGTVLGALGGAAMNALDVPITAHMLVVILLVVAVVPWATRSFLPSTGQADHGDGEQRGAFAAWRERRTVLIGLFVLTMAFTEGTGNDWLGVAAIDGYGASNTLGAMSYAVFVAAMTLGRWFGPALLDRHGRVPVMRLGAVCSFVGVLVVVYGPALGSAIVGIVLWGLGVSLGFPVGMSAAADDARKAAGRVSVVATIGYVAFLAGPALVGLVGNHVGVLRALTITAGVLTAGFLLAGATAPLRATTDDSPPVAVDPG